MLKIALRTSRWAIIAASVLFAPLVAQAQWIPLTARITESKLTTNPDKSTHLESSEGYLYRWANGNETQRTKVVADGKLVQDVATVIDNQKLRVYEVDYIRKVVREVKKLDSPRIPVLSTTHDNKPVPEELVDGIKCYAFPVVLAGKEVGKMWVSKDYKIPIKSDYEIPDKGTTVHIQSHTHDIQARREPDHKFFEIDPSFRVEKSISQNDGATKH